MLALLEELPELPVLVYPNWDTLTYESRRFLLYRDARKDGLGATLEQEHGTYPFVPSDSSTEPQSSLKGVGLHSTSHHLEHHARFAVLYEVSCPVSFFRPQALESLDKVADNYLRVQRWLKNSHRVKT